MAANCDFTRNNIGHDRARFEECAIRCRDTQGCSHFAWTDGTCYKKSGVVKKHDAVHKSGVKCGILPAKVFIASVKQMGKSITNRIKLMRDVQVPDYRGDKEN